jgi:hypothetical protein
MSDYLRALKALDWLNRNTDFRANNVSGDYPNYREFYGGLFSFSIFSNMESIGFRTGKELVKIAEMEGWKNEP